MTNYKIAKKQMVKKIEEIIMEIIEDPKEKESFENGNLEYIDSVLENTLSFYHTGSSLYNKLEQRAINNCR